MMHLMRYNDYLNDPLAYDKVKGVQEPSNAISSRYDLRLDETVKCFGGFDAKIGRYNRENKTYDNWFISSPAYDDVDPWTFPDPKVLYCPRRGLEDGPFLH